MTHRTQTLFGKPREHARYRLHAGQVLFGLLSAFCFLLVLRNSDAAIEYMGRGLSLCAGTVIPSLFPFMVISELLVQSGAGEAFGRIFARVMRWFFGVSGAGGAAVFLGSMCGFPVGARTAVSLYDKGVISKEECEHLLTFTNNPGSAFLITAVGVSLFGNRRIGVVLYAVVLGCSFVIGFFARFFLRRGGRPDEHPHYPSGLHTGGVEMFTSAVTGAATSMLTVCAYVIFFSAITGALGCLVAEVEWMSEGIYALLCGFLEMTGGISAASSLGGREAALILTAALAGWSGLSVHCQVLSLCGGRGLSFRPYWMAKAAQGVLCALVMGLLVRFGDSTWFSSAAGAMGHAGPVAILDTVAMVVSFKELPMPALLGDVVFLIGCTLAHVRQRGMREDKIFR